MHTTYLLEGNNFKAFRKQLAKEATTIKVQMPSDKEIRNIINLILHLRSASII